MESWLELVTIVATLAVSGLLTFLATQLVKQESWPSTVKLVLSIVMAGAFALATAWLSGDVLTFLGAWGEWNAETVLAFGALIWTTATVWYKVVFRDTEWVKALAAFPLRN